MPILRVYFFDENADIISPLMNCQPYALNFPMGMNPMMRSFIILGVNMSIDLGQFIYELIKFRGGNAYDKAFLCQAVSLVVNRSMTVYFINALNSFMMACGLTPSHQLSVLEFNHIYNYFNDLNKPTAEMTLISHDSTTGTPVNIPSEVHDKGKTGNMDSTAFETHIMKNHPSDSVPEQNPVCFNPKPSQTYQPIEFVEGDVYDEMKHKLEEAIKLIPKIPSEKLDIALSLVLKKTYAMDKKIRDRMYGELTDVKARVKELKMNRQRVQEQENAIKKVRIFLGRK